MSVYFHIIYVLDANSTVESFTPAQIALIQKDLEEIMNAYLDVTDDKVAELLQFFNTTMNIILKGGTCDPESIDDVLKFRFQFVVRRNIIFYRVSSLNVKDSNFSHLHMFYVLHSLHNTMLTSWCMSGRSRSTLGRIPPLVNSRKLSWRHA